MNPICPCPPRRCATCGSARGDLSFFDGYQYCPCCLRKAINRWRQARGFSKLNRRTSGCEER